MMTVGTVIISSEEYRSLLNDSFIVETLKAHVSREKYVMESDIRRILGVEEPQGKED